MSPTSTPSKSRPRVRRSPSRSREVILRGARLVLEREGPANTTLRAIALEAGVSDSLVCHYFGNTEGVIEATMSDSLQQFRTRMLEKLLMQPNRGVATLVDAMFDALSNPFHMRLFGWALVNDRIHTSDFFARTKRRPKRTADIIEAYLHAGKTPVECFPREDLDRLMVMTLALGFGYSLGNNLLWDLLGHRPEEKDHARVRDDLIAWINQRVGLPQSPESS